MHGVKCQAELGAVEALPHLRERGRSGSLESVRDAVLEAIREIEKRESLPRAAGLASPSTDTLPRSLDDAAAGTPTSLPKPSGIND